MMTTNAAARTALVEALAVLRAADPEGTHKQLVSAVGSLTDDLRWLDDDIRTNSGPVRVGDRVRVSNGVTGYVLGGLGNFISHGLVPVGVGNGSLLVRADDINVIADADGNDPGERPAAWPEKPD